MELKQCPFCGSKDIQELEEDYWEILHKEDCWIVSTGYITDYCIQVITTLADGELWNKRVV